MGKMPIAVFIMENGTTTVIRDDRNNVMRILRNTLRHYTAHFKLEFYKNEEAKFGKQYRTELTLFGLKKVFKADTMDNSAIKALKHVCDSVGAELMLCYSLDVFR